ncbi:hypothetical protein KSF_108750 [Reticulibacter mediterranei]|uniref:Uncharacterized protein n=1 Tax=Reticulibacter mediterranei TaxID=2778369 RepID=A0A8J3J1V7_9CHLR|nr:hypothetical protein [Reticulibacter mediterranei]GHP00828.1 hypothetical protein KSF_108750 [Reticulibacter mediterranei]
MYCIACTKFIPPGQVGHFVGGFREAPLCRPCSDKARGIVPPQKTVQLDLIPGMQVGHLHDQVISDLLDYQRCGGIWSELLAPADYWCEWEIRRFGGTYTLGLFSQSGIPERPRSYWQGEGIQSGSLSGVLLYRSIPRNLW